MTKPIDTQWLTRKDNADRVISDDVNREARNASFFEEERERLLKDFFQSEDHGELFANLRPTVTASQVLDGWLAKQKPEESRFLSVIRENWSNIVGKDNAAQCEPCSLQGNCLFVEVKNSLMLYVLKTNQRDFEAKISQQTNQTVTRIQFRAAGFNRPGHSRFSPNKA